MSMTTTNLNDDDAPTATMYACSVDAWAYGAVVFELIMGESLTRGRDGRAVVKRLLDILGPRPADVPYAQEPRWQAIVKATSSDPLACALVLPEGVHGDVLRACLQWSPTQRATMSTAQFCSQARARKKQKRWEI